MKAGINGVITTIENAINSAISLINGAIRLINKIPKVNIPTIGKVHFNRLETGGVLEKGQIGFLEGSGAEAVVPLEKNTKWISRVAEMMKTAYYGGKNSAAAQREQFDYDSAVDAFKTALNKMDIVLDDEVAGHFVERTVTNLIYT